MRSVVQRALGVFREDLQAAMERDPAAQNPWEVALTYPGLHAVWGYRVAHAAWNQGLRFPARVIQNSTRFFTGVDIHPDRKSVV